MNFGANFSNFFDKGKTFRPKKKFQPGTLKYSLHKQAQASLNSGINLRQVSLRNDLGIKLHNSHVIWTPSIAQGLDGEDLMVICILGSATAQRRGL